MLPMEGPLLKRATHTVEAKVEEANKQTSVAHTRCSTTEARSLRTPRARQLSLLGLPVYSLERFDWAALITVPSFTANVGVWQRVRDGGGSWYCVLCIVIVTYWQGPCCP